MIRILSILLLCALSAPAASVYVAKTGNDGTGDGSVGTPYLTVQKGVDMARAGDTVLIGAGTYAENVRTADWAGSAGSPIIINGQNVATVQSFSWENPYIHILNFTITGGRNLWNGSLYVAQTGSFCVLSNNLIEVNNDTLNSPVIRWNGPASAPFGTAGSDNVIISNVIQNIRGEMVFRVYGYRNVIVGNRLLNADNTDWFQVAGGTNYIVGNLCSNLFNSGLNVANHADFFQTFGDAGGTMQGSMGHLIESNIVIKADGVAQLGNLTDDGYAYVKGLTFRNNLFIGIAAKIGCAMPEVQFYNNVFVDCATNLENGGPLLIFTDSIVGKGHSGRVYNNAFLNCGLAGNTNNGNGWYAFDTTLTNCSADYNYTGKDGYKTVYVDPTHRAVGAAGGWDKFAWWEDHGINGGNPQFYDSANLNFQPIVGSFLIDAGTNLAGMFTTDILGVTRSGWGIGPYELGAALASPPEIPCSEAPKPLLAYPVATASAITFYWPTNQYRRGVEIARRNYTNNPNAWATWTYLWGATNAGMNSASNYTDSTVSSGIHYEYRLGNLVTNWPCDLIYTGWETNAAHWWYQYISTGTQVPLHDQRGNVVLLTETALAASLGADIGVLTNDLIGDGYRVFRHDVAAVDVTSGGWSAAVSATRTLVTNDYASDKAATWFLFILGHVPVPYSGASSPGSHVENFGAHPADWFYSSTNAALWTDSTVSDSTADFPHTRNVPADGKFDQSDVPGVPVMRVGRVDLRNMPAFGKTEAQLVSQYLARNHEFRHKQYIPREFGLVNTNGRPWFGQNHCTSLFGTITNYGLNSWIENATNVAKGVLIASSSGSGGYEHDNQLGYTTNWTNAPLYISFASTYGSYYGDWDSTYITNCFLLAPLANAGKVVSTYYCEPTMVPDTSAMNEPVSQELLSVAANANLSFDSRYIQEGQVPGGSQTTEAVKNYVSLMGDPTLRLRTVYPVTNVIAATNGSDIALSWTASGDTGLSGYHVYRAPATDLNAFTRLTSTPTNSPYTNASGAASAYRYMVRAVKLESSVNRSFYDISQGAFASIGASPAPPSALRTVISGGVTMKGFTIR